MQKQSLKLLNKIILFNSLGFPLIVYFINGLDLAFGTLVGCLIIKINFFSAQKLIAVIFFTNLNKLRILSIFFYFFGIIFSIFLLYIAINYVNLVGVLIGLTSILFIVIVFVFLNKLW